MCSLLSRWFVRIVYFIINNSINFKSKKTMIPKETISTLNFKFLNTVPYAVLNDEDIAILVGDLYECTKYITTYKGFGEPHLRVVRLTSSTLEAK